MDQAATLAIALPVPRKPRLRGRFHQAAFFVCIPACLVLLVVAPGPAARVAAVIYGAALLLQFGSSAAYHVGDWSDAAHRRMQRLDHSMIFVLIAGTYTPVILLVMHGTASVLALTLVWAGCAIGILTKLYRVDLHILSAFLYLGLGWLAMLALPTLMRAMSGMGFALVVAGGLAYSIGALVLALHRPDPWPETFGYHEVWHVFTIVAAVCLYVAILLLFLAA
jgi:hemolysin III